jgi:Protein of unknown function (DUF2804)
MAAFSPYRGDGTTRPAGPPLPPERMASWRAGRPLKRWRYVGVFGERVMACAGIVRIAGAQQAFWAVWDPVRGALAQRTRFGSGRIELPDGAVRVVDGDVLVELALEPAGEPVEVLSPHGSSYIWTRKQPVRARGAVEVGGEHVAVDEPALVDDSAGYHARRTAWQWSAGAGRAADGRAVWWNLVRGVHDAPRGSERTLWIDGAPTEVGPVAFADDLSEVRSSDGLDLRFAAEAERARSDRLLLVRSEYRQPFGAFAGTLPGGLALPSSRGVMERHVARW